MKHLTGYLLRKHRLAQNLSQEGLCKGICAVSYLSKIEQGQVEPGQEIIGQLFAALGIAYVSDEERVGGLRRALEAFFDRYFHDEDARAERAAVDAQAQAFENSTLAMAYQLYGAYACMLERQGPMALECLQALSPFTRYMDAETAFLYAYAQGVALNKREEALEALRRAKALIPCSPVYAREAKWWYWRGAYAEALLHIQQGMRAALEEGNVSIMRDLSFLEGNTYANLLNRPLMLQAFRRAAALYRGDAFMQASIQYNIGATLVEMRQYAEAMPYLLAAVEDLREDKISFFLLCHKLAIAFRELDQPAEGQAYLRRAEETLEAWPDRSAFYDQMLAVARMRYAEGYLDSDAYLTALRAVYDQAMEVASFGFRQFHGLFLIDAYTHRRKYKEALAIAQEIHRPVS